MKEADEDGLSFFLVCVCVRVRSRTVFEDSSDLKKWWSKLYSSKAHCKQAFKPGVPAKSHLTYIEEVESCQILSLNAIIINVLRFPCFLKLLDWGRCWAIQSNTSSHDGWSTLWFCLSHASAKHLCGGHACCDLVGTTRRLLIWRVGWYQLHDEATSVATTCLDTIQHKVEEFQASWCILVVCAMVRMMPSFNWAVGSATEQNENSAAF